MDSLKAARICGVPGAIGDALAEAHPRPAEPRLDMG